MIVYTKKVFVMKNPHYIYDVYKSTVYIHVRVLIRNATAHTMIQWLATLLEEPLFPYASVNPWLPLVDVVLVVVLAIVVCIIVVMRGAEVSISQLSPTHKKVALKLYTITYRLCSIPSNPLVHSHSYCKDEIACRNEYVV